MDLAAAQSRVYACVSAGDEHPVVCRVQLQLKLKKKKVSVCINRNFPQLQEPAEDTALSLSLKGLSNVLFVCFGLFAAFLQLHDFGGAFGRRTVAIASILSISTRGFCFPDCLLLLKP